MDRVRACEPAALGDTSFPFEDSRLPEMLFRYRARNYPQTLNERERGQWEEYRFLRLTEPDAGASLCMEEYQQMLESLLVDDSLRAEQRALLKELLEYGDSLLA
jgi:exodeoxyribonuclease-1